MEIEQTPSRVRTVPSFLMNQAALRAQRLVSERLGAIGAHRTHFSVLASLDEFGAASQAELTQRCGIDRSDMVALINQLATDGLVQRAPDPNDRRRNVITITSAGRQQLHRLEQVVTALQEELLAPLTNSERQELVRMLTRIVTQL